MSWWVLHGWCKGAGAPGVLVRFRYLHQSPPPVGVVGASLTREQAQPHGRCSTGHPGSGCLFIWGLICPSPVNIDATSSVGGSSTTHPPGVFGINFTFPACKLTQGTSFSTQVAVSQPASRTLELPWRAPPASLVSLCTSTHPSVLSSSSLNGGLL